jgi:hypothetical protein
MGVENVYYGYCDGLDPEEASIFIEVNIVGCQKNAEKLMMRCLASPGSRNRLCPDWSGFI